MASKVARVHCGKQGAVQRVGLALLALAVGPAWHAPSAAPSSTLVQPVAVFGADDRVALPPRYKSVQEKIGLLFNQRARTVCTAFCVAKDIVATAGHCLHRTVGERPPRLADFRFARNFDAVRDFAHIAGYGNGTANVHVMSGSASLNVRPPIDATRDWALVRLARPACSKGSLPVQVLPMQQVLDEANAKHVFQVSYHRDYVPWKQAYSRPCGVGKDFEAADWTAIAHDFSEPETLILHTCDTGGASSGSPLLLDTPQGPAVIGINVGTYLQSKVVVQEGQITKRMKSDTVANTAVNSVAFATKLAAFRDAVVLSTKAQVRELQALLKQRQLYSGAVNGTYGPPLRAAIEAYETAEGLPVTGLATEALLGRLGGSSLVRRKGKPAKS